MSTVELSIGFLFPLMLMVVGYWKEEVWLFYIASASWLVFMGFLFNNYGTNDFLYWIAWLCLGMALVCATAQLWMNKGKPTPKLEEDKQKPSEKRAKKIRKLLDLPNKLSGKDDWD